MGGRPFINHINEGRKTVMTRISYALTARRDALKNDDKGFTLIELLVVVLIIGVLAAIAIPIFLGQQETAKDSAVASDVTNAKIAIVADAVDGTFPTATEAASTMDANESTTEITLTFTGTEDAFCIQGTRGSGNATYASDDSSGTIVGTCVSNVATATATP